MLWPLVRRHTHPAPEHPANLDMAWRPDSRSLLWHHRCRPRHLRRPHPAWRCPNRRYRLPWHRPELKDRPKWHRLRPYLQLLTSHRGRHWHRAGCPHRRRARCLRQCDHPAPGRHPSRLRPWRLRRCRRSGLGCHRPRRQTSRQCPNLRGERCRIGGRCRRTVHYQRLHGPNPPAPRGGQTGSGLAPRRYKQWPRAQSAIPATPCARSPWFDATLPLFASSSTPSPATATSGPVRADAQCSWRAIRPTTDAAAPGFFAPIGDSKPPRNTDGFAIGSQRRYANPGSQPRCDTG